MPFSLNSCKLPLMMDTNKLDTSTLPSPPFPLGFMDILAATWSSTFTSFHPLCFSVAGPSSSKWATTSKTLSTTPLNKAQGDAFNCAGPPIYIVRPIPMKSLLSRIPGGRSSNHADIDKRRPPAYSRRISRWSGVPCVHNASGEALTSAYFAIRTIASLLKL